MPIFPSKIGNGKVQKVEESDLQQVKDATSQLSPEEEKAIKRRLWYLAIKPPMYSVCIVPVVVRFSPLLYSGLELPCMPVQLR